MITACSELKESQPLLKLLNAVLETGNHLNQVRVHEGESAYMWASGAML